MGLLLITVVTSFAVTEPTATTQLNPFAYNLSAVLSNDQTTLTVKYCLNANVESLEIVFLKGEEVVKSFPVTDPAKRTKTTADDPYLAASSHSVDVQINDLGIGTFTWRIEVKGAGRSETQIYSQNGSTPLKYKFYRPSSVDIVMDPTSYNYGKVLVVEGNDAARSKTVTGTYHSSGMTKTKGVAVGSHDPQGAGIYVFNPDFTPRENTSGTYVFNGKDDARFQGATYGPHRVRVSDDGRIFVASMHTDGNILWEIPATFGEWTTVIGKGVGGATYDGTTYELKKNGTFFAAPVAGLDVRGSGNTLQLLMLCCTSKAFSASNQTCFYTYEYNLGTKSTWSSEPSKDFYTHSRTFVVPRLSQVQYDIDGAVWCVSYREAYENTQPALAHIPRSVTGTCTSSTVNSDYRDYTSVPIRKAAFRFNNEYDKTIIAKWNAGDSRVEGHIYRVGKDGSGKPTINGTGEPQIDMSAVGDYINDFVWDNADNIYAVGQNDASDGGTGYVAIYCLPYKNTDVFTTSAPQPFTISNTVTWHPYHCGEILNADLWELFMEDYNDWYMNHSATKISKARADQPINNLMTFTNPDPTPEGYPGGLAMDFMINENSPWKWLGDYIQPIANPHTIPADNEELWAAFKPYYNTYYGLSRADQPITAVSSFAAAKMEDIMTNTKSNYKWLGDYIKTIAGNISGENAWRWNVHHFFNCSLAGTYWDGTLNKSVNYPSYASAGQPSAWKPYYVDSEGHVSLSSDLEWRKQLYAFFNQTNEVGYNKTNVGWVREATGDFTKKGQPKPDGDPAAGWYNAWWSATFPTNLQQGDPMPKVRRSGYLFSGWYYGSADGYYLSERVADTGYDINEPHKAHLWARWIELCLYEGYNDKDEHSLEESAKVNHNIELIQLAGQTGKSHQIDISRNFLVGSYSTLVFPFAIPADKSFLKKVTDENGDLIFDPDEGGLKPSILVFEGTDVVTTNGEQMLQFNFHELGDEEVLPANTPFLIKPAQSIKLSTRLNLWTAYISGTMPLNVEPSVASFIPVLAPQEIQLPLQADNPKEQMIPLILVDQNRFAGVSAAGEMLGLRGYFLAPKTMSNMPARICIKENAPTEEENVATTPEKGVHKVLENQRIYIITEQQKYDILGNFVTRP